MSFLVLEFGEKNIVKDKEMKSSGLTIIVKHMVMNTSMCRIIVNRSKK